MTPPRIFTSVDALRGAHGDGSFATPRQTADLVASVEYHMARADAAEAAAHQLTMERDGARLSLDAAHEARVKQSLELAEARAEVVRLRAIVEGRTVPPTPQERVAHLCTKRQGLWRLLWGRYDIVGDFSHAVLREALSASDARWWALDADRIPCAWPVVDAGGST